MSRKKEAAILMRKTESESETDYAFFREEKPPETGWGGEGTLRTWEGNNGSLWGNVRPCNAKKLGKIPLLQREKKPNSAVVDRTKIPEKTSQKESGPPLKKKTSRKGRKTGQTVKREELGGKNIFLSKRELPKRKQKNHLTESNLKEKVKGSKDGGRKGFKQKKAWRPEKGATN